MKKKLLAVALAATMVFTSVINAFAASTDFECSAFASANSGNETLEGDFNVQYTFHLNAYLLGTNAYENVMVEIFNQDIDGRDNAASNYLSVVCNGSAWWWNGANTETQWASATLPAETNVCTDADMTIMKDCDVVLNVQRKGNAIALHADITGADGTTATWDCQVESTVDLGDKLNIHLSGEQCKVTNLTFSTEGAEVETQATSEAPTTTSADEKLQPSVADKDNNPFTVTEPAEEEEEGSNVVIFVVIAVVAVVVICGVVVVITKRKR